MASIADYYTEISKQPEQYSDFLANFNVHPNQKDLVRNIKIDAVKRSIRNIVLTNKYERVMNGDFGTNLRDSLFEIYSPALIATLQSSIANAIKAYEPRALLYEDSIRIEAGLDLNYINIFIVFAMNNVDDPISVELKLKRLR